MSYQELAPPPPLDVLIDCVWTSVVAGSEPVEYDVLPDGAVDLIGTIYPDGSMQQVFVAGAMTQPAHVSFMNTRFFGIRFRPGAAFSALGVPQCELTDQSLDVREVASSALASNAQTQMHTLASSAHDHGSLDHRTLSKLLRTLGAEHRTIPSVVREATRLIASKAGTVRVDSVARASSVSRQHLGRLFGEHVGLSPKSFAEVCRVRALLSESMRARVKWSDLALSYGYSDQSHLIAAVRRVTGRTPGEWELNPGSISPIATAILG